MGQNNRTLMKDAVLLAEPD